MWNSIRNWVISSWNNRRGLAVIVFLFTLVAFPTFTYFLFKWAFGSSGGAGGATGSPLSFPWLFLGFASLIGAVFASNNTQSRVSYGILGLAFFCFILAIGPDYPLNIRLGRIMDQVLSSQGLALLAMSAGVVFVLKNTTNPVATKVLVGVLGIMAIVFAIPLLKGAIDPAKDGFKALTGLEMNFNVVLLLTVIGILWKGDVQNRFVRFLLWLSLLIFIPASIGVMVKVIKDGFTDFTNQVPALTNIPTYLPDSTPDWFKELWSETVPFLKGLPLGARWGILTGVILFVFFLLFIFFGSRKTTTPATAGASGSNPLLGAFLAIVVVGIILIAGYFALQHVVVPPPGSGGAGTTAARINSGSDPELVATSYRTRSGDFEAFGRFLPTGRTYCVRPWSRGDFVEIRFPQNGGGWVDRPVGSDGCFYVAPGEKAGGIDATSKHFNIIEIYTKGGE